MRPKDEWEKESNCHDACVDEFFPDSENGSYKTIIRKYCRDSHGNAKCPVLDECLSYALVHDERGIWGGTTEGQRKREFNVLFVGILKTRYREAGLLESRGWVEPRQERTMAQSEEFDRPNVPEEAYYTDSIQFLSRVVHPYDMNLNTSETDASQSKMELQTVGDTVDTLLLQIRVLLD